jgi:hypothetical protein
MPIAENNSCNFQETPVTLASELRPFSTRITKRIPNMLFTLKGRVKYFLMRKFFRNNSVPADELHVELNPGDWVEVRSLHEIVSTLDEKGKFKGLYFMPEMESFCGKKFKIFRKAEKIKLETNGELRKLKYPSYFLEGVYCSGIIQGGCDRSCFHYWREEWLRKV